MASSSRWPYRGLVLLTGALVATATLVFGLFVSDALERLDALEKAHVRERVAAALRVERLRLEQLNLEYSFWDTAYQNLILAPDRQWSDEYIGDHLTETYGLTLAVARSNRQAPGIVYQDGQRADDGAFSAIMPLAETLSSGYRQLDGVPYLYAVAPFVSETTEEPQPDHALLFIAHRLSQAYLDRLSDLYRLPVLQLVPAAADPHHDGLKLAGPQGEAVALLTWDLTLPSSQVQNELWLPSALLFVVLVVLGGLLIHRDRVHRQRLDESLALAMAKDPLTGTSNRVQFLDHASRRLANAKRDAGDIHLVVLQIDGLKQMNEAVGSDQGDAAIIRLAAFVQALLSPDDLFGRLGDKAFAILMSRDDASDVAQFADRVRRLASAELANTFGFECPISIGCGTWRRGEPLDDLLKRADTARITARRAGQAGCQPESRRATGEMSGLLTPRAEG